MYMRRREFLLIVAIWSNDKKIKEQNIVIIYSTHELAKLLQR